jgi:hypothetical protein
MHCTQLQGTNMYRPVQLNRGVRRALEFVIAVTAALLGSYFILRAPW